MKVTYLGHGCLLIEGGQSTILIDPFITHNSLARDVVVQDIVCDYIFLTHGHMDHVADVDLIVQHTGAEIVASYEVAEWYKSKGLKAQGMNHGGWCPYEGGRAKYVAAIHSSMLPDGSYGGNPGGFVFEDERTIYVSGDTALTMDMQLIPMTCKPLDLAALCIGDYFTMGIEDALIASDFVKCNRVLGMHYNTFDPIRIDMEEATRLFQSKGKTLLLPNIGGSISV